MQDAGCSLGDALCCAVGGIYTVIRTKAAVTAEELGEQYCLIGPLNDSCVRTEVEVLEPSNHALLGAIQHMREFGIQVSHYEVCIYGYKPVLAHVLESCARMG